MRVNFQIALLILYTSTGDSAIYSNNAKDSLSKYLKESLRNIRASFNKEATTDRSSSFEIRRNKYVVPLEKKRPKDFLKILESPNQDKPYPRHGDDGKKVPGRKSVVVSKNEIMKMDRTKTPPYRLDPVLNNIKRRKTASSEMVDLTTSDSSSSSLELKNWKTEWKEHWIKKKIEALNATGEKGDTVNMVAARPWGVACGDPGQHDMPWGNCMLAMECEPEYRIYRGDFLCGRNQFVCCALQVTNYDMYQGFDASFADSGLTTDSEEKRNRGKGSKEKKRRKKRRERKRRKKDRLRRKKKIKKNIKKIIKEIRKILNRQYRNGTTQRKKKTKQLKKFIKDLKKKYRQDRKSVKNIHEIELIKVDANLMKKLNEIRHMNQNFFKNDTFREIVVNGTINKKGARMLVEAYPELVPYFTDNTRRTATREPNDYDVEYGMLYY